MREIKIVEVENGYKVSFSGFPIKVGEYVYKSTEGLTLIEDVGEQLWKRKVKVSEK